MAHHTSTAINPNDEPQVVIKLGLDPTTSLHQGIEFFVCSLTYEQLQGLDITGGPICALKGFAVLLASDVSASDSVIRDVLLENYSITLFYTNKDGEKALIRTNRDLLAALNEYRSEANVKILARVRILVSEVAKPSNPPYTSLVDSDIKQPVEQAPTAVTSNSQVDPSVVDQNECKSDTKVDDDKSVPATYDHPLVCPREKQQQPDLLDKMEPLLPPVPPMSSEIHSLTPLPTISAVTSNMISLGNNDIQTNDKKGVDPSFVYHTKSKSDTRVSDTYDPLLVYPCDMPYATNYTYTLVSQLQRCSFTQWDKRHWRRKDLPIGLPGLACRHCVGGRFFTSRVEFFNENILRGIYRHMMGCRGITEDIRENLQKLRDRHDSEMAAKTFTGSRKLFLSRIWNRLHTTQESTADESDDNRRTKQACLHTTNENVKSTAPEDDDAESLKHSIYDMDQRLLCPESRNVSGEPRKMKGSIEIETTKHRSTGGSDGTSAKKAKVNNS